MLIALAGLPGVGKSTIARQLALELGAVWLRIDTIEQAIADAGFAPGGVEGGGYLVGYALAEDNLRLGRTVVADSVNPWMLTRDAWCDAARRAGARVVEIELICGDAAEHRRRIETRVNDVAGLIPPDWAAVVTRDYRAWTRDHVVIDTAGEDVAACVARVRASL